MSTSTVSVVIPTFNRAYCLRRAIDSALGQTWSDLEVVIIDDGSTDDTRQVIDDSHRADGRVKYHYQDNGGVVAARNRGLALAAGGYVALLDSDDIWFPWK